MLANIECHNCSQLVHLEFQVSYFEVLAMNGKSHGFQRMKSIIMVWLLTTTFTYSHVTIVLKNSRGLTHWFERCPESLIETRKSNLK